MKKPEFMIIEYLDGSAFFHPYIFNMNKIDTMELMDADDKPNCRYIQVPLTNNEYGYDSIYMPHDAVRCKWIYNNAEIDLPHENIYEFYYALRKLLIGAMLDYEISRLA